MVGLSGNEQSTSCKCPEEAVGDCVWLFPMRSRLAVIEPPVLNWEFSRVPDEGAPTKAGDRSQCVSFATERVVDSKSAAYVVDVTNNASETSCSFVIAIITFLAALLL